MEKKNEQVVTEVAVTTDSKGNLPKGFQGGQEVEPDHQARSNAPVEARIGRDRPIEDTNPGVKYAKDLHAQPVPDNAEEILSHAEDYSAQDVRDKVHEDAIKGADVVADEPKDNKGNKNKRR